MAVKKAIFLDKDGTLIPDIPYNVDVARITLSDHAVEGLKKLAQSGFLLIVISNQSGIAKGLFDQQDLQRVKQKIEELLHDQEVTLTDFYFCPHDPNGLITAYSTKCNCRKPKPGLILEAAEKHQINLSESWMIGDILNDVEAGRSAGCKTILIKNGNETEWEMNPQRTPDAMVATINEAAEYILDFTETHGSI